MGIYHLDGPPCPLFGCTASLRVVVTLATCTRREVAIGANCITTCNVFVLMQSLNISVHTLVCVSVCVAVQVGDVATKRGLLPAAGVRVPSDPVLGIGWL